jgi:hypothetical protein
MQPPDALPGTWQRLLALSGVAFAVLFLIGWFAIVEWVAWFNNDRLHESLGDLPPAEFETNTLRTDGASLAASRLASTKND